MEYIMILLAILYFSYYVIYKYILELGTSMIYWFVYNIAIFVALAFIFPVSKFMFSMIVGNGIILFVLLVWVIITKDDVMALIKERLKK